jgi:hypothetical protein
MKALDLAHGVSDPDDRFTDASEVLADWQRRCGGELPGVIAIPALLELVRSARRAGTPLARTITFLDETRALSTWAAVTPEADGTRIEPSRWRTSAVEDGGADAPGAAALVRQIAEAQVLLDAEQRVVSVDAMAADLAGMAAAMREGIGRRWTEFVTRGSWSITRARCTGACWTMRRWESTDRTALARAALPDGGCRLRTAAGAGRDRRRTA